VLLRIALGSEASWALQGGLAWGRGAVSCSGQLPASDTYKGVTTKERSLLHQGREEARRL